MSHEIVTSYVAKLMSARTPPTAVVRRADVWAHRQSARSAYAWRCSARRIVSGKKIERSANPSGASAREGFFIFWSTRQVRGSPSTRRQRLTSAAGAATINFEIYGTSFNGRTTVLQAANVGSIPTVSTNLRG